MSVFGKLRRLRGLGGGEAAGAQGLASETDGQDAGAAAEAYGRVLSRLSGPTATRSGSGRTLPPLRNRRVSAVATQRMVPIVEFQTLEPNLDGELLQPPTFKNFKRPEVSLFLKLGAGLSPVRLFAPHPAAQQPAAATAVVEEGLPEPVQQPAEIPQRDPLWFSLKASKAADPTVAENNQRRAALEEIQPQLDPLEFSDEAEAGLDDASRDRSRAIDDDSLYDSPTPLREFRERRGSRRWQAIEAFFLSRAFAQAAAACVLLAFVSTLDVPWRNWFDHQVRRVKGPLAAIASNLSQPIKERSAFFIVDDFSSGISHWVNNGSLDLTDAGYLAVHQGLSLHGETMNLESYRMDFEAKIESEAVGWVVRAADTNNYYAFKLVQRGGRSPDYDLLRYTVVEGVRDVVRGVASVAVPDNLASAADFNRISVRVRDNQITTLINGWGVDFWQDGRFERGGVGLLADRGESALVRKMSITGNEDTWGLLLYGTLETLRSVQDTFSAPVALRIQPSPLGAPATLLVSPSAQPFRLQGGE